MSHITTIRVTAVENGHIIEELENGEVSKTCVATTIESAVEVAQSLIENSWYNLNKGDENER